MDIDEVTRGQFTHWLSHPSETIRECRKAALKAALEVLGCERVAACSSYQITQLKQAVGLPTEDDLVKAAEPPRPPRIDMTDAAKAGRADLDIHLDPGSCVVVSSGAYTLRINS